MFNTIGAIVFGLLMFVVFTINKAWASSEINSVGISMFHTFFNVTNTLLLYPFGNLLVKLSGMIVKDDGEEEQAEEVFELPHIEARFLETPSFAVEGALKETVRMGELAIAHVELVFDAIRTGSQKRVDKAVRLEQNMNEYEKKMTEYLAEISKGSLTDHQRLIINDLFYTVSDLERISDHCDNLAELTQTMINEGLHFSMEAMQGFEEIAGLTVDAVKAAVLAVRLRKWPTCSRWFRLRTRSMIWRRISEPSILTGWRTMNAPQPGASFSWICSAILNGFRIMQTTW